MPEKRKVHIFYSYAHKDKELRDQLAKHLGRSHIEGWHDREILPGQNWASQIDTYLDSADIILLLVSVDFMASDYCYGKEMRRALDREKRGEAVVIPIILRPVSWESARFSYLQVLPPGARPIVSWQDPEEALVEVAKGIRRSINDVLKKLYLIDAKAAITESRYEDAAFAYIQVTQLFPEDAFTHQKLSDTLLLLKRPTRALAMIEKAIDLDSHQGSFYASKAAILAQQNLLDKALDTYLEAIELGVNDPMTYQRIGDLQFALEKYEDALESYNKAINFYQRADNTLPQDYRLYVKKAKTLITLGEGESALEAYSIASTLSSEDAQIYADKGNIYLSIEKYAEALKEYERAISLEPDTAEFWRRKGQAHKYLNQLKYANDAYEEALQREKNNAHFYKERGDILFDLKRFEEAVVHYNTAIDRKPDFVLAYIKKADALEMHAEQIADTMRKEAAESREKGRMLKIELETRKQR